MENTNPAKTSSLPPIGVLLNQSWQVFIQSILSLFILNVIGIVIYFGLAVLVIALFILSGAGSVLLKNGLLGIVNNLPALLSPFLIPAIIISLVFGIIYLIVGVMLQISSIIIVNNLGKVSFGDTFKKSFSLIIPLFLVNILVFILTFGAAIILILPGILFAFLLLFAQYEVVLNNQRWVTAIKRSVTIISKNFGAIFIRLLLVFLIYIAIVFIIPRLLGRIGPEVEAVVGIISFIINFLLGWYLLAYQITLYKQASMAAEGEEIKGIAWMWIAAIIGWLIAIGIYFIFLLFKYKPG